MSPMIDCFSSELKEQAGCGDPAQARVQKPEQSMPKKS
jgi:hypothetical protein